jgi:ABC-type polysaccharide/polyol phosphate transport system ATPase subunit
MDIKNSKIVSISNLSLDIPVYDSGARSFRKSLFKFNASSEKKANSVGGNLVAMKNSGVIIRALDDINISINEGDRVAILGHNGSGKSTLLKVIAGIHDPTQGLVVTRGRVIPLFNMMEGISPDSKGRETIAIRGSILGLTNNEILKKMDDIISFCELDDYIDLPVRTYSTGMLVRLMFGIATSIEADILVMDEFIGAGDAAFIAKANKRLKEFVDRSKCLIVATHSQDIALNWCNKALLLEKGKLRAIGTPEEVLKIYPM